MPDYFGRVYKLEVGNAGEVLTIDGFPAAGNEAPAQVQFTVTQTPQAHRSYAEITVFGLKKSTRERAYNEFELVTLQAGYQNRYGTIFKGQIENIEIGRDGADSFIKLFCQSATQEWPDAFVGKSWGENTPAIDIIRDVAGTFGLPVEIVGEFGNLPKAILGRTLLSSGRSAMNELARNYQFSWFIENERMIVIKDGAEREGQERPKYSPMMGLIGTPQVTQIGVDVNVLMDPVIRPGNLFDVESETGELTFNGVYYQTFPRTLGTGTFQAVSMVHEGDFYGDTWQTSIEGVRPGGRPPLRE